MKFIFLAYLIEDELNALPESEQRRLWADCDRWQDEIKPHVVASAGLESVTTATTLRRRNGKLSYTDGPYAETKEQLGGFTIIEARDLDEALKIASKNPAAKVGSLEVRPVLEPCELS